MRNFIRMFVVMVTFGIVADAHAGLDACLDNFIDAHRAEVGEQAIIRHDQIAEWEEMCVTGATYNNGVIQQQVPDFRVVLNQGINIQAIEDEVVIYALEVNRGNCPLAFTEAESILYLNGDDIGRFPRTLKYGEVVNFPLQCEDDYIIQVDVDSTAGGWTFTYE